MAVTAHVYTRLARSLVDKIADLDSDALKVALLSFYTVGGTQDTAQFVSDVITAGVGVEVILLAGGYRTGGLALTTVTFTETGHVYTLTCANPVWRLSTITAAYALFYDSTPGLSRRNPVICYWDFGGNVVSTTGNFTLTISASGLLTVTGA